MTADAVGGVWCHAIELARALAPRGLEVVLAVMGPPPSEAQRAQASRLPNLRLAVRPFKLEWMEDPWEEVEKAGAWLLGLEREFEPDLIHLNGYAHGALPWSAPVLVAGHSCCLSWWKAVKGGDAPPAWGRYAAAVRAGLAAADSVVAPSAAMLASLEEHYGPLPPSRVIPNGREFEFIFPGHKKAMVLCAGRLWDEAKNVRAVRAIAPELSWPVWIAGDCTGPDGRDIEPPNVRCLGRVPEDEMPALFAEASIFAHPAKYEPFGLAILEAAIAGCALVLGDIPSLRENWDGAALFVPPEDSTALRESIQRLIMQPRLLADFAARARTRAGSFGSARMASKYLEVYSALLAGQTEARRRAAA